MEIEGFGTFIFILVASIAFVYFMTRESNAEDNNKPPQDE